MKTELLQQCNVCDSATLEVIDAECNIVRCRSCGYIFDSPRPTLEELIQFYSRPTQYDSWLTQLEARDRLWRRRLRKLEATRKPGSLLDVGTGIGQFLHLARGSYTEVYGTEVSSTAIKIARKKYNLNLFQGTIEGLDLRDKTFDNITLFHVLEHVPDPRSVLKTCHSLLSAQGIIVVGVPNEVTSLRVSMKRMLVKSGMKKQRHLGKFGLPRISLGSNSDEIHLSHFTPKVLRRLLHSTGFRVIEATLDPYYIASGVSRLRADLYYSGCLALQRLFKINVYDTMLVIARKVDTKSDRQPAHGY